MFAKRLLASTLVLLFASSALAQNDDDDAPATKGDLKNAIQQITEVAESAVASATKAAEAATEAANKATQAAEIAKEAAEKAVNASSSGGQRKAFTEEGGNGGDVPQLTNFKLEADDLDEKQEGDQNFYELKVSSDGPKEFRVSASDREEKLDGIKPNWKVTHDNEDVKDFTDSSDEFGPGITIKAPKVGTYDVTATVGQQSAATIVKVVAENEAPDKADDNKNNSKMKDVEEKANKSNVSNGFTGPPFELDEWVGKTVTKRGVKDITFVDVAPDVTAKEMLDMFTDLKDDAANADKNNETVEAKRVMNKFKTDRLAIIERRNGRRDDWEPFFRYLDHELFSLYEEKKLNPRDLGHLEAAFGELKTGFESLHGALEAESIINPSNQVAGARGTQTGDSSSYGGAATFARASRTDYGENSSQAGSPFL